MIFNTGWTKQEIESLTYFELIEYVTLFYKLREEEMFDFFRYFCIYNCESTYASRGDKSTIRRYVDEVRSRRIQKCKENNIEEQFEGLDNG